MNPEPDALTRLRPTERRHPGTEDIDVWPTARVVAAIIEEDAVGVRAVAAIAEDLARAIDAAVERAREGGMVHAFGAGTSGRLALLDATEATPTFGAPPGFFSAHFPGGADAFFDSGIDLEDAEQLGAEHAEVVRADDIVLGITASGSTAYVRGALTRAREAGALLVLITNDPGASLAEFADFALCADTGPEVLTGSTRMKAGTATKVILNAFSTALMIRLGRTYSNLMVGLVATNAKLHERALVAIEMATGLPSAKGATLLDRCGGDLPLALVHALSGRSIDDARHALDTDGGVRAALERLGVDRAG